MNRYLLQSLRRMMYRIETKIVTERHPACLGGAENVNGLDSSRMYYRQTLCSYYPCSERYLGVCITFYRC